MVIYFVVCLTALLGSALTFFSGFGLGTILLPVFALFFPIDLAVGLTAAVHFLNNLFKLLLVGKHADVKIILRFGIPSIVAAFLGAYLLTSISNMEVLYEYVALGSTFQITPVKLIIAFLLFCFALFDIVPYLTRLQFDVRYLPLGGLLSGFFGGLSGHQGALRAAFLIRAGLTKEVFVATGVVIACMIDVSRLSIYSSRLLRLSGEIDYMLMLLAVTFAFIGAYVGNKALKKITIHVLQYTVAMMLILFALFLGLGVI